MRGAGTDEVKMFTRYDKAGAAAIGGALTTIILAVTDIDPEAVAAIGTLITAGLTYFIPNKG